MRWEDSGEAKCRLLERYRQEHGSLKMQGDFVMEGVWLARWLNTQQNQLSGKGKPLSEEQYRTNPVLL